MIGTIFLVLPFDGKAIYLNGKDSGVTVPDSDSLDTPDEITGEAWIYPLNVNVDYPEIVLKGYGTAFETCVLKDLAIDWEFHIGGWKTVNSGAGTISLKKWFHAAVMMAKRRKSVSMMLKWATLVIVGVLAK